MFWCLTVTNAPGQTNYQRILSFGPELGQGSSPRGQLLEASDGVLYGTTYQGGSNNLGTVFRVAKDGAEFKVLHAFDTSFFPFSGVVEGIDGTLYGTTSGGGAHNAGTVFTLTQGGTGFTSLHHFNPAVGEGSTPIGPLLKATDGKFYGTTAGGGSNNYGSIFRLNADGSPFETLFSFAGTNGSYPVAGLIQGQDGLLYGVTRNGGASGLGTAFRVSLDGGSFTVLHHFLGQVQKEGGLPLGSLLQASDYFLYGTTYSGGNTNDAGTVFRVSTNGTDFSVLHVFGVGGSVGGTVPGVGLVEAQGGWLYGSTTHGGINDGGVVFRLKLDGSGYAVLHSFTGLGGDGSQPFGALLQGTDGALYGSAYFGGDYAAHGVSGTLFRLFAGPAPVRITSITRSATATSLSFAGGIAGQSYQIQAIDTLGGPGWESIGVVTAGVDGKFQFSDSAVSNRTLRFYRSALP